MFVIWRNVWDVVDGKWRVAAVPRAEAALKPSRINLRSPKKKGSQVCRAHFRWLVAGRSLPKDLRKGSIILENKWFYSFFEGKKTLELWTWARPIFLSVPPQVLPHHPVHILVEGAEESPQLFYEPLVKVGLPVSVALLGQAPHRSALSQAVELLAAVVGKVLPGDHPPQA